MSQIVDAGLNCLGMVQRVEQVKKGASVLRSGGAMRTRVLTIISVGITIGFLLGMSVVAMSQALLDGETAGLEISFTVLTGTVGAMLVTYVVKTIR